MADNSRMKFKTVEELQNRINEYFLYTKTESKPLTIAGLAYYLGCDRRTIYEYEALGDKGEKGYKEYALAIKNARDKILLSLEESMLDGDRKNITGPIFLAKNYGYSDRGKDDNAPQEIVIKLDTGGK